MDLGELRHALSRRLANDGYKVAPDAGSLELVLVKGVETIGLALCPEREEGEAFLGCFEAAMQCLIDARAADLARPLGLALAFGSTAFGRHPSYRRALKKYSNSIVFEDLGVSLYLVRGEGDVIVLAPSEINAFLRHLDQWIAAQPKAAK